MPNSEARWKPVRLTGGDNPSDLGETENYVMVYVGFRSQN